MRNYFYILVCIFFVSCQVLEEREVKLNPNFCPKCEEPLREMMLKSPGIYVVKFYGEELFYNYDAAKVDIDSLEYLLMKKGYLPRKDSIVIYPVCCSKGSKNREELGSKEQEESVIADSIL